MGWKITNASSATLVLKAESGHMAGWGQQIGTSFLPGMTDDFELNDNYIEIREGTVTYEGFNPDGTDLGTITFSFSNSYGDATIYVNGKLDTGAAGDRFSTNLDHATMEKNSTSYFYDQGNAIWNLLPQTVSEPPTVTGAPTTTTGDLLTRLCTAKAAKCEYDNATITPGYSDPAIIAAMYGGDGGNPAVSNGSIQTMSGWTRGQSNTYSLSERGGLDFSVVSTGIERTSSVTFESSYSFNTAATANTYPQKTTEIVANAPIYTASGTFTVKLGHTTWTFMNAFFSFPRTTGVVKYNNVVLDGDVNPPVDSGVHG